VAALKVSGEKKITGGEKRKKKADGELNKAKKRAKSSHEGCPTLSGRFRLSGDAEGEKKIRGNNRRVAEVILLGKKMTKKV